MFIHTLVTLSADFEAKISGVENNRENCIHKKRQDFEDISANKEVLQEQKY